MICLYSVKTLSDPAMDENANQEAVIEIDDSKKEESRNRWDSQRESSKCGAKVRLYTALKGVLWVFPLLISFFITVFFVAIYTSALNQGHIEPFFPYISDAGTKHPQAAFFVQILDIILILIILTGFIRYKQLKYAIQVQLVQAMDDAKQVDFAVIGQLNKVNFAAYLTAVISGLSLIIPGNFRSNEWMVLHSIGAIAGFIGLYIWAWSMVYMCHQLAKFNVESRPISLAIFTAIGSLTCLIFAIVTIVSIYASEGKFFDSEWRLKWNKDQAGYLWHLLSSITEWILINIISFVMICIAWRIKQFTDWHAVNFSK